MEEIWQFVQDNAAAVSAAAAVAAVMIGVVTGLLRGAARVLVRILKFLKSGDGGRQGQQGCCAYQ